MRESYRLQKNQLQSKITEQNYCLHVFILFTGNELPQYDLVFSKVGVVIKRLLKEIHEEAGANT